MHVEFDFWKQSETEVAADCFLSKSTTYLHTHEDWKLCRNPSLHCLIHTAENKLDLTASKNHDNTFIANTYSIIVLHNYCRVSDLPLSRCLPLGCSWIRDSSTHYYRIEWWSSRVNDKPWAQASVYTQLDLDYCQCISYLLIVPVLVFCLLDRTGQAPCVWVLNGEFCLLASAGPSNTVQFTIFTVYRHSHDSESFPEAVMELYKQFWSCH